MLYCGGTSPLRTSKATAPSPPAQHNTHTSRYKWQADNLQERHMRAAPAWPTAATPTATANLGKGEFEVRLAGEKGVRRSLPTAAEVHKCRGSPTHHLQPTIRRRCADPMFKMSVRPSCGRHITTSEVALLLLWSRSPKHNSPRAPNALGPPPSQPPPSSAQTSTRLSSLSYLAQSPALTGPGSHAWSVLGCTATGPS